MPHKHKNKKHLLGRIPDAPITVAPGRNQYAPIPHSSLCTQVLFVHERLGLDSSNDANWCLRARNNIRAGSILLIEKAFDGPLPALMSWIQSDSSARASLFPRTSDASDGSSSDAQIAKNCFAGVARDDNSLMCVAGSLFNHACTDNVLYMPWMISAELIVMVFVALSDIASGDEARINYNARTGSGVSCSGIYLEDINKFCPCLSPRAHERNCHKRAYPFTTALRARLEDTISDAMRAHASDIRKCNAMQMLFREQACHLEFTTP
jgi:hypothetical protein